MKTEHDLTEPAKPSAGESRRHDYAAFNAECEKSAKPSDEREALITTLHMMLAAYIGGNHSDLCSALRKAADMLAADGLEIEELESDYTDQVLRAMKAEELAQQVAVPQRDAITVNLMRSTGLDKHKARECAGVVVSMLAAPQPLQSNSQKSGDAHEMWAAAQLVPGEGIEDGVARVEALLGAPRVPMTEDEIETEEDNHLAAGAHGCVLGVVEFVRAIEAHHKIGVKL